MLALPVQLTSPQCVPIILVSMVDVPRAHVLVGQYSLSCNFYVWLLYPSRKTCLNYITLRLAVGSSLRFWHRCYLLDIVAFAVAILQVLAILKHATD